MDNLLSDVPNGASRLDDVLVTGNDEVDHLRTVSLVLERLLTDDFRLNKAKFKFLQKCVTCVGHIIDGEGVHSTEDKLAAIRDAQLLSLSLAIMLYLLLMPYHFTKLAPLHNLLKKDTPQK